MITVDQHVLPAFALGGAQKCGTTSFFDYLRTHPCIATPQQPAPHYFDLYFDKPEAWYLDQLTTRDHVDQMARDSGGSPLCAETSPYYLFHPAVPARLAAINPDCRMIFILRDPVRRAYSHYQHVSQKNQVEPLSFQEAIDAEPARLAGEIDRLLDEPGYISAPHRHYSYLARGRYAEQLERWLDVMPREQILVLQSERMYHDPETECARAFDFLRLPAFTPPTFPIHNKRDYEPMSESMRRRLSAEFKPHNERLFSMIGERFDW